MITARGVRKWIHTRGQPKLSDGRVTQVLGSFQDITARRQLEKEHRETNERLQMALQASRMGTWEWDIDTDHVRLSPETLNIFGIEAAGIRRYTGGISQLYSAQGKKKDRTACGCGLSKSCRNPRFSGTNMKL